MSVSQTSRSAGMTLIETLVSLALASMLLIAMWTWQASQMRNGKHALANAQALRDAMSCCRLLREDAAFLITVPEGSLQVSDPNHISLVTGSVIPGHPRGFRRVEYQWSKNKGLSRTDNGVVRWLSDVVSFEVKTNGESSAITLVWSCLNEGEPTGETVTTMVTP